jgi:hypothetical protein
MLFNDKRKRLLLLAIADNRTGSDIENEKLNIWMMMKKSHISNNKSYIK